MKPPIVYYDFRIDSLTPETLRLGRFVDYVTELHALFGGGEEVHFSKVRKGSAVLELWVPEKAAEKVDAHLRLVGGTDAPPEVAKHHRKLTDLLRRDHASGRLARKNGPVIIDFPGIRTPLAQEAIVYEATTLDGTVVGVKGVDDSVTVWIKTDEGLNQRCNAKRDIARQLAPLWDSYIRLNGKGKWRRGWDRRWTLEEFDIQSFERLDDTPLEKIVDEIQQIEGNGWNQLEDAQATWRDLRAD